MQTESAPGSTTVVRDEVGYENDAVGQRSKSNKVNITLEDLYLQTFQRTGVHELDVYGVDFKLVPLLKGIYILQLWPRIIENLMILY